MFSCTCSNHWESVHLIPTIAPKAHPPPNYPPTLGFPHPCLAHWQTCSQAHKTQMSRHSQHQPPACALRPTENCLPVFTVHGPFTILNWNRHKICLFSTHFHSYLLWIEQLGYTSFPTVSFNLTSNIHGHPADFIQKAVVSLHFCWPPEAVSFKSGVSLAYIDTVVFFHQCGFSAESSMDFFSSVESVVNIFWCRPGGHHLTLASRLCLSRRYTPEKESISLFSGRQCQWCLYILMPMFNLADWAKFICSLVGHVSVPRAQSDCSH